jgi:hypothetical protein
VELVGISFAAARLFVEAYHRHHKPPQGWKFGAGLMADGWVIGVVIVGRPVARNLDDGRTLEVTRCCVREGHPNACSQLYSWARREKNRRRYKRIITYTLASESGVSLKAANWMPLYATRGGSWSVPSRPRHTTSPTEPKIAWIPVSERALWTVGNAS